MKSTKSDSTGAILKDAQSLARTIGFELLEDELARAVRAALRDPTTPKRSLRTLESGDYPIFYCGLQAWNESTGWEQDRPPALYICGYFEVEIAGMTTDFSTETLQNEFGQNFHVRYSSVYEMQRENLMLVKGGTGSRLLAKACQISAEGTDRSGKPLKVLSPEMQGVFGKTLAGESRSKEVRPIGSIPFLSRGRSDSSNGSSDCWRYHPLCPPPHHLPTAHRSVAILILLATAIRLPLTRQPHWRQRPST